MRLIFAASDEQMQWTLVGIVDDPHKWVFVALNLELDAPMQKCLSIVVR